MRNGERGAPRPRTAALALILLALSVAAPARAQMIPDGNIFYFNADSTWQKDCQGVGVSPYCDAIGYIARADSLCWNYNLHNHHEDPLLPGAIYQPNVIPNWVPGAGSPAWTEPVVRIDDDFFKTVCYHGAIGPNPPDYWPVVSTWANNPSPADLAAPNVGWVIYDSTGANRQDLHLSSMPDPRPLAVYRNINLYQSQTWGPDSNYLVGGQLRVKSQANLTIAAGTVIFGERATLGTIVVERGGHITAIGDENNPIIMTCDDPPGQMQSGAWGGLIVNGYGRTNIVNSCAGDSVASEGGAIGYWGGDDNAWDGCQLKYVRIEYSGKEITPNNELNSFTMNGMGSNSHMDYCQAFYGQDDCFEWFGGKMDCSHLIGIAGKDDGIDTQLGTQLRVQFAIIRNHPGYTIAGTQNGDKGTEQDDNEYNYEAQTCNMDRCMGGQPGPGKVPLGHYVYTDTRLANVTFIGDRRVGSQFPGPTMGVNWRRGTAGTFWNSIVAYQKVAAIKIDDNATWNHHCNCLPGEMEVLDVPVASGRVFLARSTPNPFRNRVNFSFSLAQSGIVRVEIYAADGSRVQTIADESMAAGPHSVTWNVDRAVPSGMYFYRVFAGGKQATGKIARVK